MNSSQRTILVLIAILTCFVLNNYYNSPEYFSVYNSIDSVYAPIGQYNINNTQKPIPITQYANQVAYDLQNPFPQSTTGTTRSNNNSSVWWNPVSYRDIQEPDGQFVGVISPN
jgi:hypothetical protein